MLKNSVSSSRVTLAFSIQSMRLTTVPRSRAANISKRINKEGSGSNVLNYKEVSSATLPYLLYADIEAIPIGS
jgi:hypothetical protein